MGVGKVVFLVGNVAANRFESCGRTVMLFCLRACSFPPAAGCMLWFDGGLWKAVHRQQRDRLEAELESNHVCR